MQHGKSAALPQAPGRVISGDKQGTFLNLSKASCVEICAPIVVCLALSAVRSLLSVFSKSIAPGFAFPMDPGPLLLRLFWGNLLLQRLLVAEQCKHPG